MIDEKLEALRTERQKKKRAFNLAEIDLRKADEDLKDYLKKLSQK